MTYAVVLGNRNNDDATLSTIGIQRLEILLQLLADTTVDKVILSGGIANAIANVSESQLMYNYLISHGIDSNMLILEQHSATTVQNAIYSCRLIPNTVDTVILVTSHEHMYRKYHNPIRLFSRRLPRRTTLTPYTGGTL